MTPQAWHAALVGLAVVAVGSWWWVADRRWRIQLVVACAVGSLAALIDPAAIPLDWITPLQEADTAELMRIVEGGGQHAGPTWTRLLSSWALVDGTHRLDGVVRLGLGLGAVGWLIWAFAWAEVAGPWVAGVLALALVWQPLFRFALFSEGPAQAVWLASAMTWTAARRERGEVAVVAWGLLLAGLRVEMAVLPVLLLARRWLVEIRPRVWWTAVVVALEIAVRLVPASEWRFRMLAPLDPGLLFQPLLWVAVIGPGVAVAALAGIRRFGRTDAQVLALVLAGVVLTKAYWAAGHGPMLGGAGFVSTFEQLRYLAMWAPWVVLLAARGAAEAPRWFWATLAIPGIPAAILLWPDSTSARWGEPGWTLTGPLGRDAQVEVRNVLGLLRGASGSFLVDVAVVGGEQPVGTLTCYGDERIFDCLPVLGARYEGLACGHGAVCPGGDIQAEGPFPGPYAHPAHGWTAPATWRVLR